MPSLFPPTSTSTLFARVALHRGIEDAPRGRTSRSSRHAHDDAALTYAIPAHLPAPAVGQLVQVPLGKSNTPATGIVLGIGDASILGELDPDKVKPVTAITPAILPPHLLELAHWLATYYVCPLGMVLLTMLPAAVKQQVGRKTITDIVGVNTAAATSEPPPDAPRRSPRLRAAIALAAALPASTFPLTPKALAASDAGLSLPAVKKLIDLGVFTTRQRTDVVSAEDPLFAADTPLAAAPPPTTLSADQHAALAGIAPTLGSFAVHLLHGVTGSGKTEIYLRLIDDLLARSPEAGAIILVPEIALTPQTARRFLDRFGIGTVAVLHSGLTAAQRNRQWSAVAEGSVRVVVGARSAVFAPLKKLSLIVVDEEHDSSYKQDQLPRYHARDVAIKRAQLERCPVVLGSATPSLESWANATPPSSPSLSSAFSPPSSAGRSAAVPGGDEGSLALRTSPPTPTSAPNSSKPFALIPAAIPTLASLIETDAPVPATPAPPAHAPARSAVLPTSTAHAAKYHLWSLPTRVAGVLPRVEIVDLVEERRLRASGPGAWRDHHLHLLGPTLEAAIAQALDAKGQVLLLLNRRGYANYLACTNAKCGWVMHCDHCDATTIYHLSKNNPASPAGHAATPSGHRGFVRCHHCLAEQLLPRKCPLCASNINTFGLGTQRVEEELQRKFAHPHGIRLGDTLLRVDSDTMRSARDYFHALSQFAEGKVRILLGTQMIAKGLDFPNVRLVGVVNADTALALPDFRAAERTFQLVAQVAGRAGRGKLPGRVIVQTVNPTTPSILLAAAHDFPTFAAGELALRAAAGLPPATRMARIVSRDTDLDKATAAASAILLALKDAIAAAPDRRISLRGPMPCPIARIADHHRIAIELLSPHRAALQHVLAAVRAKGWLKSDAHTAVDIDPIALL